MIPSYFLIPVHDNDGQPHPLGKDEALRNRLVDTFGGFTDGGLVDGMWKGENGRIFSDRSRRYEVALASWMDVPALLDLIVWAIAEFEQEAIFISIAGVPEIMAARPP